MFSLINASLETIYVLGVPEGVAWNVAGVNIRSNCAYISCPVAAVPQCPLLGMACGLSAVGAQPIQPGETFEFEWKHEFEILNYTCDQYAGGCQEAHAIAPSNYEVSIQYGLSYASGIGFDSLEDVTTLTKTLSFPQQQRLEFVVE